MSTIGGSTQYPTGAASQSGLTLSLLRRRTFQSPNLAGAPAVGDGVCEPPARAGRRLPTRAAGVPLGVAQDYLRILAGVDLVLLSGTRCGCAISQAGAAPKSPLPLNWASLAEMLVGDTGFEPVTSSV